MDDKLKQLYDLYVNSGIIKTTDFETFAAADDSQRQSLYQMGVDKGLFKTTDYDTFNSVFLKKKEEIIPTAQPQPTAQAQPMAQKPQAPAAMASSLGASSLASPSAEERGLTLLTPEKSKQMAQEAVTGAYMGSQKAAPVMKVEALPVSAPSKSEADFSSSLEEVNKDLMDYDEDYIVPKLEYLFGKDKYNFEFNWYRDAKEAIEIKAPNGKKTVIPVDAWTEKGDIESAEAFKKFLNENKPKLAKLSDEYNIYQSTIKNEQDMKKATESMNAETMQLNKIQQDLVLENTNLDKEFKYLQSVPQSERGSQDYINRLEQFNKKREDFSARLGNASQMEKDVTMKQNQLYTSIGRYTSMKAEQGGFFGGLYNSLLGGYSSMGAAATGIATDVIMSLPLELTTSPKDIQDTFTMVASSKGIEVPANMDYEKFKQWSQTLDEDTKDEINSQVKDYLTKRTKGEMLPSIRKGLTETIGAKGTTPEYIEDAGIIKGGIYGLAASLPAMSFAGAGPVGTMSAFFLQGYDATMKEMESEEFKDVSENEKYLVALPVGIVTAALEEFGMRNVLGKSGLVNDIVAKALSKSGAGTTATTFKQLVENEIESRVARGALVLTAAGLSEAETGAAQAAAEIGIKEIYNTVKGKDMFKTPETVGEFVKEVAVAGVQEAIGGVVMGSFNAVGTAYGENNFDGVTNETLDIYSKLANDDNARNAYAVDLKMKIVKGDITAEQGKKALDDLNNSISAFNSMPDGLAPAQQRQAFSLLRERKGLEAEIQGKDEAMVKKQKARIAEINSELEKVSEMKEAAPSEAPSVAPSEAKPAEIPQEIASLADDENVVMTVKTLEEVPEEFRDRAEKVEGADVEVRKTILGFPIGKKTTQRIGDGFRYTLTGKEAKDYAIQKQTAGQVPVQPTARPSQEVAQGEPQAEPQVTAQAGVQEKVVSPTMTLEEQVSALESMLREDESAQFMLGGKKIPNNVTVSDAIDEEGEIDYDAEEKVKKIAKDRGIGITRDREISFVARDENDNVIGGAFTSYDGDKYTFDIVIDKEYDGKGVGSELLDRVINIPYDILEQNPNATIEIDVVSPVMQEMLKKRGFEVTRQVSEGRVIMEPKNKAQFMLESQQSQAKQEMIDEATKLMEQEEKNGFSEKAFDATNPEPTVKPISIEIKENTRLADKVKRMGLKELIGKKINLVMADQLKVGDVSIGKKILKRMGGPFFPLIDELFGKVAWASINKNAASSIVNGAIKSDYTVVYNMNPSAIDSNAAIRDTFIAMVRKMPKDERDAIVSKIVNQIKGKKFGPKTEQVQKDILKVKTLSNFEKMMSDLDVDTKAKIINMILPSKNVKAETEIGLILQGKGITIESIREMNIEQFVADLPAGALTMVIEVQDKNGNKITKATKEEAIITPEQQKEEGLPSHDNYPIYIRGKAVAILSETVPFWNILKDSLNTINVKVAKIVKETSGRAFTAKEARSAEMRSASMTASTARKVSDVAATEYEKFISLLSRAFPTVEVVANQKEFDKLIDELGAKKLLTKDQNVYGAVYNGKIYLNPSLENYNTPIHEFGHIWLNVAKNVNPELYEKGLSLVSNSPYVQQIKDNKDYQRVIKNMMKEGASESEIDAYIKEEALATAIGDRGESFVIAAQQKNFKEWLNKLYSVVRKLTGISKYTAEQLETITFDEFTKAVAVDLMSGNEIFTKLQVKEFSRQLQLSTGKKDAASIVKIGRASGFSEDAIRAVLVKKGFTKQEADAAMSKPEAGKKIELGEELMEGYERMMVEVDGIIEKGLNRGSSQNKIMENVLAYVQGSKAYENATDQQREQIVREVKQAFGEKMKTAPSVGKILGTIKDIKKVTMTEMSLLKKQLTDAAKGAKDLMKVWNKANKKLTAELKDMVRSGSINTKQLVAVLRKFQNTNLLNQDSIDSFINYMARVFADANYAERISNIRKNLKAAKRNIQTKIGVAESVQPLLQQMLSINPTLIPESVFDKYEALVAMLGQRKAVLELRDIDDVRADVTAVMDAVTAEVSKVPDLADRFENYADKVVDEDGKVQYSETIEKMLEDDVIDADEVAIMRKYKSKIMPATPKAKMTEAEIAQEKQDLIAAIKATKIEPSKLALRDERDSASDLSDMIDDNVLEAMDNKELKTLLAVIGNINNGYMPHQAQLTKETIASIKNNVPLENSVVNAKPLSVSKVYAKIKSIFTRKDSLLEMVRRNPLFFIDQVFGDFKTKDVFKSIFEQASKAQATYKAAMTKVNNRLNDAQQMVSKSLGNDPAAVKRSSYRMMAYMLQLEHQTNPAGVQTKHTAMDYLKKTIANIRSNRTPFSERDADALQGILDEMEQLTDADGNVDLDAFYSKFNKAEQKAIGVIQEINLETRDKALYTSAVIRGDRITPLNNYVHHNAIADNKADEQISGVTTVSNVSGNMQPSTKGKSLIKRTGALLPLDFDVFASAYKGANYVLMDYHLTEPVRTARKTINRTRVSLENKYDGKTPKEQTRVLNAIEEAFEEATENLLNSNIVSNSIMEDAVQEVAKQGYRAVLASAPRWVGELVSNMGFAMLMDSAALKTGYKMTSVIMSSKAPDIMVNLKSKNTARIFSSDALSGRFVDTSILGQTTGTKAKGTSNGVANKLQQIYNNSIKKYKNSVEFIADTLITTPDKMMMRPVWFGAFANEFKRITGKMPDFDMIAENNEAYMNENKEALAAATEVADRKSTFAGATDNAYMGILKGTVKPNQSALTRGFNMFNNFMTRFLIFEYTTARTAVNAAIGNGYISRKQGAAMLAGVATRMTVYTMVTGVLSSALAGLFGDEEEEDEKSLMQKIGQSMASGATALLVGRDFGNATKTILNYGVERINENYLDALREGDYDPYKDAIAFTAIPPEKKGQQTDLYDYIKNMAGPFGPILKTADLAVKKITEEPKKEAAAIERAEKEVRLRLPLEILGNLGFIPLYKDVRKIVLKQIYKDLENADSKTTKTDSDKPPYGLTKEEYKRYFPEEYKEKYGEGSLYYEQNQLERELEKEKNDMKRRMLDEYYDYVPKQKSKKGFGSKKFGEKEFGKKKGGFGSKGFGEKD